MGTIQSILTVVHKLSTDLHTMMSDLELASKLTTIQGRAPHHSRASSSLCSISYISNSKSSSSSMTNGDETAYQSEANSAAISAAVRSMATIGNFSNVLRKKKKISATKSYSGVSQPWKSSPSVTCCVHVKQQPNWS